MKRIVLAGALALLSALAAAPAAWACSCLPPKPPREARAEADALVAARVQAITTARDGRLLVTLRVERTFEGPESAQLVVVTSDNTAACGYPFEQGERYLVYATRYEGAFHTGLCTRTARLAEAQADLAAFDALDLLGARPRCGGPTAGAMVQGLLLALGGVFLGRRRR